MSKHKDFILTPITELINEVNSILRIDTGIEFYPLLDYIMQSLFLKMTGFQEQKLRCIYWELATNDYCYRYEEFFTGKTKNNYSSYGNKNKLFKDLIRHIEVNKINDDDRKRIFDGTKDFLESFFQTSILNKVMGKDYFSFLEIFTNFSFKCIGDIENNEVFTNCDNCANQNNCANQKIVPSIKNENNLTYLHEKLHRYRNRCAHNTTSYQQNLPSLDTLQHNDYKYENYFIRFALLILIDEIMMLLYKKYLIEIN